MSKTEHLLRSRIVFPQFELTDFWKIMAVTIASSFSERIIPSALERINPEKK